MPGNKSRTKKDLHTDTGGNNELFFRTIVDNIQSKITVLDANGSILYQNEGYVLHSFYKPGEMIGKSFFTIVHEDYVQKVRDMFADLVSNPGTIGQMQIPFRFGDGSWHVLDIRAKNMLDVPEVAGIVVNSRDITDLKTVENELQQRTHQLEREIEDRKKAQHALLKSEEFFKAIVQNSSDSIGIVDTRGNRIYLSPSFRNVGGYEPDDMLGKSVFDILHPDDRPLAAKAFQELLSAPGTTRSIQARFLARDGTYIWVEVLAVNMLNDPIVQGIVMDTRDITDRRRIEEELHRNEQRYRTLVQNSSDIIVVIDEQGTNQYISSSYEKITGYTIQERLGQRSTDLVHPEDLNTLKGMFRQCRQTPGGFALGEARYRYRDGAYHWFEISALNLLHDPNVHGVVLTFRDISERKRAEEKLKEEMEITTQLLSLSEAVATITDVDRLMLEAARASKHIMHSDMAVSYLWDKQAGVFVPGAVVDMPNDIVPLFRTENVDMKDVGSFLSIRKPFLVRFAHSVLTEPVILPVIDVGEQGMQWLSLMHFIDQEQLNAMMVIPLMSREEMLGMIIGIYLKEGRAPVRFSERYTAAVRGIGNQVSTALEQAKLYRESVEKTMELAHRIEVINTMYEIDRSILSSLTSADILSTVTRMAGKLLPCDVAAIMLVDTEKKGFNRIASSGVLAKELGSFFLLSTTSVTEVIRSGRLQYVPDLSAVKDILPFESELLNKGLLSVIRVPLSIGNEVIGTLGFGSRRASAFTREDLLTAERLGSQISVALANARLISDLEESSMATIKSLSNAIDAKSKWTAGHSEGVARYAQAIGKALGLDRRELGDLEVASMLHDIGKIGTYAYILDKQEKLADEEWSLIKEHPDKGVEILSPIKQLQHIIPVIRHHHEYFDGTGYPGGLRGEEIPLLARILSVADAVDAMSYDRPYRKHMGKDEIIRELNRCSGTQFDPRIVQVFLSVQNILDR